MLKRLSAVGFIFVCSTAAWMILAASIFSRTNDSNDKLRPDVASTWGAPQQQLQPIAALEPLPFVAKPPAPQPVETRLYLDADRSRVHADLGLEYRQKGLLWYSTYVVRFSGAYRFLNSTDQAQRFVLNFYFPAKKAMYDELTVAANGQTLPFSANDSGIAAAAIVPMGRSVEFQVTYRSRGLESWHYNFGKDVQQAHDFELTVKTDFKNIDFPASTLSPTEKREAGSGWDLAWRYRDLISGFDIGLGMPDKLQPGPLAGQISLFAPVSLLLFFFVLFIMTTVRKVDLHPMNYFFLAAAFFAFHLLFAYSVDHISIQLAFVFSSLVSVGLVVSYLHIVLGARFAIVEAGLAQLLYLVLFSFSFFLKGFTGLAITIGCIVTLFVAMQVTARMQWSQQFAVHFQS